MASAGRKLAKRPHISGISAVPMMPRQAGQSALAGRPQTRPVGEAITDSTAPGVLTMFSGCRQCLCPRPAGRDSRQPAIRADRLLPHRRLPRSRVQRRAHLRDRGTGKLLWPELHGGGGATPHALLRRMWRACRGSVAGDRPNPQGSGKTAACTAAWAGGTGVVIAGCCIDTIIRVSAYPLLVHRCAYTGCGERRGFCHSNPANLLSRNRRDRIVSSWQAHTGSYSQRSSTV
jgi:hypothetical protein